MTAVVQTYQKIKDLRDKDKHEKQKEYQKTVETFEKRAGELYERLREKETAVEQFNDSLSRGTLQAAAFVQHRQYIEHLEAIVDDLQPSVQQARMKMEHAQTVLTDAYIEVKKYEKLIEMKEEEEVQWMKHEENARMDELSMNQYLNFLNR
ncbi:flagellar export protein FliJ [Halobacillus kuroshimensis]|uniref:Flagellar FliJ protein n=1 Tax=Halobacillus kuroshimensis TaxID=302481 RepID=A0ABS3DSZ6_9BACI|nr:MULTISPECIES: flagellar export protein FliJ [Halobacillus]MBN8234451.1 flagellar export protein FliJ [Halobacillus kuroshimensis]